jgi:hypothetical protein
MGKASSAKKVARAARAGGNRRSGQRRALGFPAAVVIVIVVGLALIVFARARRDADAFPRAKLDHIHSTIDIYTCVADAAATATSTTTSTTATTAPASSVAPGDSSTTTSSGDTTTTTTPDTTATTLATSTTLANPNDVHGEFQPAPTDAQEDVLGIHTHGDGLIHIHPFADSAAGRKATLGVFLDQVGISMTNESLVLPAGGTFTEGTTKCEGGKDGQLQVAKWDNASDAAKGGKPNQIFNEGFDKIRLGANESFVIAFMPSGSTIPAKPDVQDRINNVSDLGTTTTAPSSEGSGSNAPSDSGASGSSSDPNASSTTATTAGSGSASSSGP